MPGQGMQRAETLKSGESGPHPSSGPAQSVWPGADVGASLTPLVSACVRRDDNEVSLTGSFHLDTGEMLCSVWGKVVETMRTAAVITAQGHQALWCLRAFFRTAGNQGPRN